MCEHVCTCAGALEVRRGQCIQWNWSNRQFKAAWHGCWEESQILCKNSGGP